MYESAKFVFPIEIWFLFYHAYVSIIFYLHNSKYFVILQFVSIIYIYI